MVLPRVIRREAIGVGADGQIESVASREPYRSTQVDVGRASSDVRLFDLQRGAGIISRDRAIVLQRERCSGSFCIAAVAEVLHLSDLTRFEFGPTGQRGREAGRILRNSIERKQVPQPNQPFFLYLAFDTPHSVYELPTQAYPAGGGTNGGLKWLGTPGHMINTASGKA